MAGAAKPLKVGDVVGAVFGEGHDVVEFEVAGGAAVLAVSG